MLNPGSPAMKRLRERVGLAELKLSEGLRFIEI